MESLAPHPAIDHLGVVVDFVSVSRLGLLQQTFPFAEFGVSLCKSRWSSSIGQWCQEASRAQLALVAHVSGPAWIKALCCGSAPRFGAPWSMFSRVQLNLGKAPRMRRAAFYPEMLQEVGVRAAARALGLLPPHIEVILQVRKTFHPEVRDLAEAIAENGRAVSFLFDGRGKKCNPAAWQAPPAGFSVGYAGGINVDTIHDALVSVSQLVPASTKTWLDLESGAKDEEGRFDFVRVEKLLSIASNWVRSSEE